MLSLSLTFVDVGGDDDDEEDQNENVDQGNVLQVVVISYVVAPTTTASDVRGRMRWKGADSKVLLVEVVRLLKEKGWQVGNVDTVLVAERPKLKPHITAMRNALALRLGVDPAQVGVKATTNEGLGPTGREEGIACHAVALVLQP